MDQPRVDQAKEEGVKVEREDDGMERSEDVDWHYSNTKYVTCICGMK